jgi:hypothetical protein
VLGVLDVPPRPVVIPDIYDEVVCPWNFVALDQLGEFL